MTKKIYIKGMGSEHCAKIVENTLKSLDGVHSVKVDLKEKIATVELHKDVKDDEFVRAIDDAGYEVVRIE
ncbi:Heavy metal transport/detoxification protein [Caldicellulosiruptor saccharolyticus DSM 8903]|uniref:Heavy metal transport/detoxification protein n=1 Tax=Caldicellulosiruptor saccharolyticus (strain ATCC 43494 / DSM 8903 / Tp8T 6331) TaxID=351627 RepID=A4XG40_CALS8|nr:heavy metal-associated domain-containing protein [Caldicellulosiruptor saccharolyticus]ABP65875.1 Heavy metal transport/detoxification protein [Caldicellulosiruptor saccharolyticus DSM 8903]